ncbi:hypothetical protein PQX77_019355 [Marasmius sp. AFHP31]|nr:hypothetical protein PQX77_019355 [Marasmius sp. AFHP31]
MKPYRLFIRVQRDREYRDRDTDIISTRKSRELKDLVKELEAEARDSNEAPPIYSGNYDKISSSSVSYTELRAPNSPPPNTISETEARLFARYNKGGGWYEWNSTRFGEEDSKVVVHPVWGGCVLWIEKDVCGWAKRWWLRGKKGRVRVLKTPQGLIQGVINSKRKPGPGQSQSQSQAPPTFSQPQPSSSSSSSSFPTLSQSINLSQLLLISSSFTIKPRRPLTKAQQVRQHQDGEAGIDADASKAENEILTKENRELKKVKELEADVRELKEPEPTLEAEAPTPSPISRAPSTLTSISIRSAAHSVPMMPSIESPILPPPQPQLWKPIDRSLSVLPVQDPTRATLSKHKQVEPRPTPPAPRVTDVLAGLKFSKRKAPSHPVSSQLKRKRPRTDDVNVSGPLLDRLFTPTPPPSVGDDGEQEEGVEEKASVPEMKTKELPSTNTNANVGRRQQR